ncbi:RNA-binding cell elongation regulator Jag/EloR [Alkalicoccobacillus plakortidis]|uniref:RNA-binding protein KhpB n=1 Tax=Alkalicoccobacillus plakortidis TaxID=444060 RepID=A0ABT0XKP1_9BACI|nr:RNA-binding cell elongation regulator Jag/EloR [Alkalicoccobacillus plakortidis]MCM2676451.1 Jag N-terminal domain-containing protein [Alkalicoccobacillus plakortidis]
MLKVRVSGKTIDEAVANAYQQLDVPKERMSYEVIEEARKGFLGFGSKQAIIEAYAIPDPEELAHEFLTKTIEKMGIAASLERKKTSEGLLFSINCEEERDTARLIGKRGQTLDSLEYLVGLAANRNKTKHKAFQVDVGEYRSKRYQTLRELAVRVAKKAKYQEDGIPLEPMNARERKVVHQVLYRREGIMTFSKGKGSQRHVIVKKSTES